MAFVGSLEMASFGDHTTSKYSLPLRHAHGTKSFGMLAGWQVSMKVMLSLSFGSVSAGDLIDPESDH